MPPRHVYWTIILEGKPTAFRAHTQEELLPTLKQLQTRHPDAVMKWFARGKLWHSPEEEKMAMELKRSEKRGPKWRPGGEHRDPREQFKVPRDEKRRRFAAKLRRQDGAGRRGPETEGSGPPPSHGDRAPQGDRPKRPWTPRPQGPRPQRPWNPEGRRGPEGNDRPDGPRTPKRPWNPSGPPRPFGDRPKRPWNPAGPGGGRPPGAGGRGPGPGGRGPEGGRGPGGPGRGPKGPGRGPGGPGRGPGRGPGGSGRGPGRGPRGPGGNNRGGR